MQLMDEAPFEFVMNHEDKDLIKFQKFVHRTFNSSDLICFLQSLRHVYKRYQGMENIFQRTCRKSFPAKGHSSI